MEGTPITWIYMALPLVALTVNLLWPRRRSVQVAALFVLVLAAWLHGSSFAGMNPHARALAAVERMLAGEWALDKERAIWFLHSARAVADQTIFDVSLGLTLGIVFAFIPPNVLSGVFSRPPTAKPFHAEPLPNDRNA